METPSVPPSLRGVLRSAIPELPDNRAMLEGEPEIPEIDAGSPREERPRGRRAAWAAGALVLAVLTAAGFAFRGRILEEWHLYRLGSKDPAARAAAAEELAALCRLPGGALRS